jgi:hypothetical protein
MSTCEDDKEGRAVNAPWQAWHLDSQTAGAAASDRKGNVTWPRQLRPVATNAMPFLRLVHLIVVLIAFNSVSRLWQNHHLQTPVLLPPVFMAQLHSCFEISIYHDVIIETST